VQRDDLLGAYAVMNEGLAEQGCIVQGLFAWLLEIAGEYLPILVERRYAGACEVYGRPLP
jgi:hypothetical protein